MVRTFAPPHQQIGLCTYGMNKPQSWCQMCKLTSKSCNLTSSWKVFQMYSTLDIVSDISKFLSVILIRRVLRRALDPLEALIIFGSWVSGGAFSDSSALDLMVGLKGCKMTQMRHVVWWSFVKVSLGFSVIGITRTSAVVRETTPFKKKKVDYAGEPKGRKYFSNWFEMQLH